ncbi:MAG: 3-deoxy-manno-octulosonate cytidylyltransferase [Phycisphaerales bacterium]|nr:3-deoxy-manno-octulosonate cytidylyltransferase [Phycisphaerales bacterium]
MALNPKDKTVVCAFIPARYAATRFPGKLMQVLGNKPVIRHTYDNAVATKLFDRVFVVTDSKIIYDEIVSHGGNALMSKKKHESGSDRIAEAVATMKVDIVVNIQGDEPFVQKHPLRKLIQCFKGKKGQPVQVASLMQTIKTTDDYFNPNFVKVVVDEQGRALFFSRAPIPFNRDSPILESEESILCKINTRNFGFSILTGPRVTYLDHVSRLPAGYPCYEHIGVYAFRKQALLKFSKWSITTLEKIEKIECLRYLEKGITIQMVHTEYMGIEIDTPEDLERAQKLLK